MASLTIGIEQLAVGMYVLQIVDQKAGTVQIKSRGRVSSQAIIDELKRKGVKKLVIDTDLVSATTQTEQTESQTETSGPQVSLEAELVKAENLYQQGITLQKSLYDAVHAGTPFDDFVPAEFARALVSSLDRNPDALLLLSRIREKDTYLLEHSLNVGILSAHFARFLGMSQPEIEATAYTGLLHDLGKIKIPDEILHKPGRLTDNEMNVMKQHVQHGVDFLAAMKIDSALIKVVSEHHERLDGLGYPYQLKDDEISYNGRILAITDMYDALTADRCYKAGMPSQKALQILMKDSETKLDATLLRQFIKCMGIYPMGSLVELSNQRVAMVMHQNEQQPLRPLVKTFYSISGGHYIPPRDVDLSKDTQLKILRAVTPAEYNIDINRFFKESIMA
ncbi:HD-GYP domain-containing protein [Alteromonas lipolytica]|uniref:Metal-dependent phosphohydrolase n=1 Tax=Alteromonas lipolytica TaxID=1856405 RepID=A0A1E8FAF3_9ALTE|nr:HD-GYP domain-containing protein [Alteromonas lipolytica]OFI32904.1 metal-dependent phosphohydrolase [Alteromonas lipolytica]GGF64329.1 phosphodiesterase [Alteromonas lipolytica]